MHSVDSLWCFRNEDQSYGLQPMRFLEKGLASDSLLALTWSKLTVKRTCVKQEKNTNLELMYYNFKYAFKYAYIRFYIYKIKVWTHRVLCAQLFQLCPILFDPVPWSLSVSSVHGILQARILEWVAISFSRGELTSEASIHFFYLLLGNCNPAFLRAMKTNVQRILKL